jgi:hypothetical protein
MERAQKFLAIWHLAQELRGVGQRMAFDRLAGWLNARGYRTNSGTPYLGGRGTARLVRAAYDFVACERDEGDEAARPIALAFTRADGRYAYD